MSFSADVKYELVQQCPHSRHCMIAELAGILFYTNIRAADVRSKEKQLNAEKTAGLPTLGESLEAVPLCGNTAAAQKYMLLLNRAYDIESKEFGDYEDLGEQEIISISPGDRCRILADLRLLEEDKPGNTLAGRICDEDLLKRTCCKRAFIRGAFLAAGSMSNPGKSYHFEIACRSSEQAGQMQKIMAEFGVDAKVTVRRSTHMLYIKEGEQIVDMLNIMEAYVSLMKLENIRIVREMRGSVNRRVNCETANIQKTVDAAVRQLEDIEMIRDTCGLESLSPALREVARARLEWPQATLQELGQKLDPPVGKSGVNHRLRKISQIADKLR